MGSFCLFLKRNKQLIKINTEQKIRGSCPGFFYVLPDLGEFAPDCPARPFLCNRNMRASGMEGIIPAKALWNAVSVCLNPWEWTSVSATHAAKIKMVSGEKQRLLLRYFVVGLLNDQGNYILSGTICYTENPARRNGGYYRRCNYTFHCNRLPMIRLVATGTFFRR